MPKELAMFEVEVLLLKVVAVLFGGGMARRVRGSVRSGRGVGEGGREEERKKERKLWESPVVSLSLTLPLLLLLLLMPCFPLGWREWSSGERRAEGGKGGAEWVEPADGRRSVWIATGLVDEDGVLESLGNIACWLVQVCCCCCSWSFLLLLLL